MGDLIFEAFPSLKTKISAVVGVVDRGTDC